jgi:hypothetical protein
MNTPYMDGFPFMSPDMAPFSSMMSPSTVARNGRSTRANKKLMYSAGMAAMPGGVVGGMPGGMGAMGGMGGGGMGGGMGGMGFNAHDMHLAFGSPDAMAQTPAMLGSTMLPPLSTARHNMRPVSLNLGTGACVPQRVSQRAP